MFLQEMNDHDNIIKYVPQGKPLFLPNNNTICKLEFQSFVCN